MERHMDYGLVYLSIYNNVSNTNCGFNSLVFDVDFCSLILIYLMPPFPRMITQLELWS